MTSVGYIGANTSLKAAISSAIVNNSQFNPIASNASYINRVATFYNIKKKRGSTPGQPYSPRRPWIDSLRENDEFLLMRSGSPTLKTPQSLSFP
jgi:hypothetical protein